MVSNDALNFAKVVFMKKNLLYASIFLLAFHAIGYAQPSNDDCAGAIELTSTETCTYTNYTTEDATDSSGIPAPGCAFYSGGDVWFTYTVNATGEVTIDTQTVDFTDSGMAIYTGTCGSLTLVECDDDDSPNGTMSYINLTGRTPGEVLYIRIWEYGNNDEGLFGICATAPSPPTTTDVSICLGDPSQDLTASGSCTGPSSTNTINGNLDIAGPYADTPPWFIVSTDPCAFDPTYNKNYDTFDFQVDTDGVYVFEIDPTLPPDFMGYIVINDPLDPFTYGSCATGTWIAGDDDSGPGLDASITASLLAGVDYTLVTTLAFSASQSTPYVWNVSGPGLVIGAIVDTMEWYTTATGGSPIGSGASFDPVGVAGSGLADTNTPGIYSYWAACSSNPALRTQADFVIGKVWDGSEGTDWYDDDNWTPSGVPTSTDCVVIANVANSPIVTGAPPIPPPPAETLNLTVQANAFLDIDSNSSLIVMDWINVDPAATVVLRDTAILMQDPTATTNSNVGAIKVQRTVSGLNAQDYVYWATPVESFAVTSISPGTDADFIWEWIPTVAGNGVGEHGEWQNTTESMANGKGYIVQGVSGVTIEAPQVANTSEFIGRPNNGTVSIPITRGTYTGTPYFGSSSTTMAENTDDNWNLIGNPYPSAISADDFINANTITTGTIYLWTHSTDPDNATTNPFYDDFVYNYNPNDYIEYNLTGPNPPGFGGFVAAGQAFFVQMDDGATSPSNVVFTNAMRNETYDNSNFFRTDNSESQKHRIWLDLISPNNQANSLLVGYIEGATNGVDPKYDGNSLNGSDASFYSLINDDKFGIQGRALPFEASDVVPLGITVPNTGNYSIAINTLDGLFSDENEPQDIYLEDTYLGIIHDLKINPYSFSIEEGAFNDRFILRFTNDTLSIDDFESNSNVIVYTEDELIKVKSIHSSLIESVTIYDVLGRKIIEKENINNSDYIFNNLSPLHNVLFVKVQLLNGFETLEKIIH